jgi:putative ABC transport system permease protein
LVTFQFAIAIALLAGTIGVYKQFNHMQNQNLGFKLDNMLVVKVPMVGDSTLQNRFWVFEENVRQIPSVVGVTYSSIIPGKPNMFNRGGIHRYGDDPNNGKNMRLTEVDSYYPSVYEINLVSGNGFTGNAKEDANSVMLNLRGAEWLDYKSPEEAIGTQIMLEGRPKTVVGILVDFKQLSPKEEIEPQIFRFPERYQGFFTVKLNPVSNEQTLSRVKQTYNEIFPGNPFDYFYLDEFYKNQYKHDKRFGMVFFLFSLLSMVITVLGLLGLSAYSAEQRKREIGIRKVLGATPKSILQLLFRDYLSLWFIAGALSVPVVWNLLNEWLTGFATRIETTWVIFIPPLIVVLIISIATVFSQSLKAAAMNPVESIKQE